MKALQDWIDKRISESKESTKNLQNKDITEILRSIW
jgi:hypothetical protein